MYEIRLDTLATVVSGSRDMSSCSIKSRVASRQKKLEYTMLGLARHSNQIDKMYCRLTIAMSVDTMSTSTPVRRLSESTFNYILINV